MSKWIAEFELEDGDTMPEHMDLNYMGAKIDFHCRPMWIPVSERLPDFNDIVLASTDSDYDELRVILTVYSGEEFWFNGKIKAWMPLPEPYMAESEG